MSISITMSLSLQYSDTGASQQTSASIEAVAVERHSVVLAPAGSQSLDVRRPGGEKLCTLLIECGTYDGSVTYTIDSGAEAPLGQPLVLVGQKVSGLVNPQPEVVVLRNNGSYETSASLVAAFAAP